MAGTSRARELACYSFLVVFANDSIADEGEVAMLKRLARWRTAWSTTPRKRCCAT